MKIPADLVPAQSDHSLRCGISVCSLGSAPSSAQKHAQAKTESAPIRRRLDGRGERMSGADREGRETVSRTLLLSVSQRPK